MKDIDTSKLRADVGGFTGRFFYDEECGDIAYIAEDCDNKQCDCEEKLNADGDQDCSVSLLDDTGNVDDIGEPIVRMLNAVGPLLDTIEALRAEVERLKQDRYDALSVTSRDGLLSSEWVLRTGKAERERDSLRSQLSSTRQLADEQAGEIERLRLAIAAAPVPVQNPLSVLHRDPDEIQALRTDVKSWRLTCEVYRKASDALEQQLAAMRAARDEACDIADRFIDSWGATRLSEIEAAYRITELRKVGGAP